MRLNIIRFKVVAKKRHQGKENVPIGSAIKYKRHHLRMTLEEASKDICSVSYLSKLENNIIVPSDHYVELLKKRFCIEEEPLEMHDEMYQTCKNRLISDMLNDRRFTRMKVFNMGYQTSYQTLLFQLAEYVLSHESKQAFDTYQQMIPIVSSMPDEEFAILVGLVSRMLYDESRYQESNEVLAMMPEALINHQLLLYRDKWVLVNAVHMDNRALFHLNYPKYHDKLVKLGQYKQMNELNQLSLAYYAHAMSVKSFQMILNDHPRMSHKSKIKLRVINLLINGYHEEALHVLNTFESNHQNDFFIMRLCALDGLHAEKDIIDILKSDSHRRLNYNQSLIIGFFRAKYLLDKEARLVYLRTVILGDHFITDDVMILDFLLKSAHHLFKTYYFYKEASEVYTKFTTLIHGLKKSEYFNDKEPQGSFLSLKGVFFH